MASRNLNVAMLPLDVVSGDAQANLQAVERCLSNLDRKIDLLVLPEMFNTGFTTDLELLKSYAEPNDGLTISTLEGLVNKFDVAICGGFIAVDGSEFYNRGFMIIPGESPYFYDKRHLFCMGGEARVFTRGLSEAPIVNFRTWNLKLSICYDLRFPVWNRNRNLEYDALIVPANWPDSRFFAWKHLLIARAIENQAYVVGCNRSGIDAYGKYFLHDSLAFSATGYDIVQHDEASGIVYATLDSSELNYTRETMRAWSDADDFSVKL